MGKLWAVMLALVTTLGSGAALARRVEISRRHPAASSRLAFLETAVRLLRTRMEAAAWRRAPLFPATARIHLQRVVRDSLRLVPARAAAHPSLGEARTALLYLEAELSGIPSRGHEARRRLARLAGALGHWLRAFRDFAPAG